MSPLVPALLVVAAYVVATLPTPAAARALAVTPAGRAPGAPSARVPVLLGAAVTVAALTLGPAVAALLGVGWLVARRLAARAAAGRAARDNAAALPDVCRALAAELRAGAPPPTALARAAADAPPDLAAHLRRLAAAGHLGAGPPGPRGSPGAAGPSGGWPAPPGAERLHAVAALWSVAADAGAGLADGLDRLAAALAAEQRQRAEVAAQLAGPRASAAVLGALPLFGLGLAGTLGADPLSFMASPLGLTCLLLAAALDAVGIWWVRRITERASR